jgi:5-(aminomethyl)-3-furanmethanol phosphate kinase
MAKVTRDLTIVKLGGSHALQPHLHDWLTTLARCGGRAVVTPGGGPFADQVRKTQVVMGFDDRAAHHMALLAMEQFGAAICSLERALVPAASLRQLRQALHAGNTPVWMAAKMSLAAADRVPPSWQVTSDSLSAWLAGRLGARRVMLVKHGAPFDAPLDIKDLAAREIVDPLFAHYLDEAGAEAVFVGPADHARALQLLGGVQSTDPGGRQMEEVDPRWSKSKRRAGVGR